MCLEAQEAIGELKVPSSEGGVNQQINKDLSETLIIKKEAKKDFLSSLMEWRVDGEARKKFLIEIGKYGEEDFEMEIDKFEEKLQEFKMNNPTISHIYY